MIQHRLARVLGSRPAVAAMACVATLGVTGVAYAVGSSGTNNVVDACARKAAPHTLTLSTNGTCARGTKLITWNKTGPQGLPGTPGAQGPQGVPGLTGFHTVTQQTGTVPAGNLGAIDVSCASGETAISGGYSVPYTATVLENHPKADNPGVWTASAAFPSVSGVLTVYVQCATLSPAG